MLPRPAHETPPEARRLLREASLELARLRRIRGAYRRTWRRSAAPRLALAPALLGMPLTAAAGALTPSFVGQETRQRFTEK